MRYAFQIEPQIERVRHVLSDKRQHTLGEIQSETGDVPQSIASRIRDLRLAINGGHTIVKKQLRPGVFAYRLVA